MKQRQRRVFKLKKSLCLNDIHTVCIKEYTQHKPTFKDNQYQKNVIYEKKKPVCYSFTLNNIIETNDDKKQQSFECKQRLKVFSKFFQYNKHLKYPFQSDKS